MFRGVGLEDYLTKNRIMHKTVLIGNIDTETGCFEIE